MRGEDAKEGELAASTGVKSCGVEKTVGEAAMLDRNGEIGAEEGGQGEVVIARLAKKVGKDELGVP
jgi:hypothetical protein